MIDDGGRELAGWDAKVDRAKRRSEGAASGADGMEDVPGVGPVGGEGACLGAERAAGDDAGDDVTLMWAGGVGGSMTLPALAGESRLREIRVLPASWPAAVAGVAAPERIAGGASSA